MLLGSRCPECQDFSQRFCLAEITVGSIFRQYDCVGTDQLACLLSSFYREVEQFEESRFGKAIAFFGKLLILIGNDLFPILCGEADELLDSRDLAAHDWSVSESGSGPVIGQRFPFVQAAFDTVDAITVMKGVVTQLESDIEQDQQCC